jgi:serine/threonine-protein kinase HipA
MTLPQQDSRRTRNTLFAWMNQQEVGRLVRSSQGLAFYYSEQWLLSHYCRPISLSLPLRAADDPWRGNAVQHYVEHLLPQTLHQRQLLCRQYGARSTDPFDLLAKLGTDCPGGLQLTPEPVAPQNRLDSATPLDNRQIERLLQRLRAGTAADSTEPDPPCLLAGGHDKTSLLWHQGRWHLPNAGVPGSHIVKLPFDRHADTGFAMSAPLENSWLCQQLAVAFGVPVARSELLQFGAQKALLVERDDRRPGAGQERMLCLPREDMCQAFSAAAGEKYQINGAPSLARMARLLLGSSRAEENRLALMRYQLVFWMLCALDGHAKTFSLNLWAGGSFDLAAPYGVLSGYPLIGYSQGKLPADSIGMALWPGEQDAPLCWQAVQPEHWLALARRCALPRAAMVKLMQTLAAQALQISATARKNLPAGFPVNIAEPILQGIVHAAQRLRAVR